MREHVNNDKDDEAMDGVLDYETFYPKIDARDLSCGALSLVDPTTHRSQGRLVDHYDEMARRGEKRDVATCELPGPLCSPSAGA